MTPEQKLALWGDGPWLDEPDEVRFEHAGLPCRLRRNDLGAWCGYVGVPVGHPAYGREFRAVDVDVHGGLSWSAPFTEESADPWWFGFDCMRAYDLVPFASQLLGEALRSPRREYRDVHYACAETESLAEQLRALTEK